LAPADNPDHILDLQMAKQAAVRNGATDWFSSRAKKDLVLVSVVASAAASAHF